MIPAFAELTTASASLFLRSLRVPPRRSYSSEHFIDQWKKLMTPTRDEIPEKDKWDLTHLFADVGKWNEDFALAATHYRRSLVGRPRRNRQRRGRRARIRETLDQKVERLYHYASLQLAGRQRES